MVNPKMKHGQTSRARRIDESISAMCSQLTLRNLPDHMEGQPAAAGEQKGESPLPIQRRYKINVMGFLKQQDTMHDSVLYTCEECGSEIGPVEARDTDFNPESEHPDCPGKKFYVPGNTRLSNSQLTPAQRDFIFGFIEFIHTHEPELLPVFEAISQTANDPDALAKLNISKKTFIERSKRIYVLKKAYENNTPIPPKEE
jgi:hypothetical protein